jgi:hypothetical protein
MPFAPTPFTKILLAAMTAALPAAAHAATVELNNLCANVQVIPEDRTDVAVDMRASDSRSPLPTVTRSGDRVLIDGSRHWSSGCHGPNEAWLSHASSITITIHTPRDVRLRANGAINGDVRAARGLDLDTSGCGHWRIADVSGALSIRQSGAANIQAGAAGEARLELSGVTHMELASARSLTVDMSGAGKVWLKAISGPVDADLSGIGSVDIASGRADHVRADVSGMGGFALHGAASALDADVSGVGSVRIDRVYGPVRKSVSGIGHVSVGS